jgi:hypothetical protein
MENLITQKRNGKILGRVNKMVIKITPIGNNRKIIQFIPVIDLGYRHPRIWREDIKMVKKLKEKIQNENI